MNLRTTPAKVNTCAEEFGIFVSEQNAGFLCSLSGAMQAVRRTPTRPLAATVDFYNARLWGS